MVHCNFEDLKLKYLIVVILILMTALAASCNRGEADLSDSLLFTLLEEKHTHIDFKNTVEYTEEFNTYTYRNFYNGAGVGIGDFNNDDLPDIYFCGNQTGNRLYINKGGFEFEDYTERAGVSCSGSWSTGVSIADVNGDGFADIYVCKSGKPDTPHRNNELFINNGDLTFSEKAGEYGLSIFGLSNHASFFDFDRDGDLDCYLLNNSYQSVTDFVMEPDLRQLPDTLGGNKLLRNDNNHFTDVTLEAGIYCSRIGFGLGVAIADIDRDGWPDIYISNDFFERDYLYINNRNGTFRETLQDQIRELSAGAMGADIADLNNDTWPEIFATEMTPEGNARLKTKALFDTWDTYRLKVENGYYNQFARNVLQLNNRNGSFSEIGRLSGVNATDWSWGALIMDLDNDGWKDIFVANGIYKDLLDQDFLDIYSNPSIMRSMIKTEQSAILSLIEMIPSVRIPNYAFHNNTDLTFTNLSEKWGLATPSFSNGTAYGDLDNDGDLDLVVNNVNMPPFVYRNETDKAMGANYLSIKLKGSCNNVDAVGASVTLFHDGNKNYSELIPARGFQSTVDNRLHFGLGSATTIDSMLINWPDGKCTVLRNVAVNQFLKLDQNYSPEICINAPVKVLPAVLRKVGQVKGLDFKHTENDFNDFERDRLLFQMLSNEGPHLAVGDANGDGRDDIYACGAKDSPGALFIQDVHGRFNKTNEELFNTDKISEDTDCSFFDADGDGDQDLYVASGGNEFPESSSALADRLYINDGYGNYVKSEIILPAGRYESTSCVQPADYDGDGDIDLFVGIRLRPFAYGLPVNGYLLENDGTGKFMNVTEKNAPGLIEVGMITDMSWADVDDDGDPDILIVGDWMPIKIFMNDNGVFTDESDRFGLSDTEGWWHTIAARDLNSDGHIDFVLGNHGLNSNFKASEKMPVTMYVNDFDLNGSVEQIICAYSDNNSYPVVMKNDLVKQIPSLAARFVKFDDYKETVIGDIFSEEILQRSVVLNARYLESCAIINTGSGSFDFIQLPVEAQFSPVYSIAVEDFDNDGFCDVLIGGNQYRARPQTGIYDASYGLLLRWTSEGLLQTVPSGESGFFCKGEIRDLKILEIQESRVIAVARNNDNLQFYFIGKL